MIAENGDLLAESAMFAEDQILWMDLDLQRLNNERRRLGITDPDGDDGYDIIYFSQVQEETDLIRPIPQSPFIPEDEVKRNERFKEIINFSKTCIW